MRRSFLTESSQESLVSLEKSVNDVLTNIELYKNCEALKIQKIENPAKEFAESFKCGYFENMTEIELAELAEIVNGQSDAIFGMEPRFSTNYVKTLYDLNQTLLDVRQMISNLMALDMVSLSMKRCEDEIKAQHKVEWDTIDDLKENDKVVDPIAEAADKMDRIHDDVFGDMVYDYGYRCVNKLRIPCQAIPGSVKGPHDLKIEIDLVLDAQKGQPITEAQKGAYLSLIDMDWNYLKVKVPEAVVDYYLNKVLEDNTKEVTQQDVMCQIKAKTLYIDRKGQYGFLCDCKWDEEHGICILVSDEEIRVEEQDYLF